MARMGRRVPRAGMAVLLGLCVLLASAACGMLRGEEAPPPTPAPTTPTPEPTPAEPTPAPTPEARWPELGTARITTNDLNVRMGPGTHFEVLGRLNNGDEVPVSGRAQGQRWLALPAIGWIAYDPEWVELPVDLDDLPHIPPAEEGYEFVAPPHPTGANIGIPVVDTVIGVVERGDRGAMGRLAAGADPPPDGFVPPGPCPDRMLPASELDARLDEFFRSEVTGSDELRLYAVVRDPLQMSPPVEGIEPFLVVFAFEGGEGRQVWLSPMGDITWFSFGCEAPMRPGEMLRLNGGEPFYWARPPAPPPVQSI